MAPLNPAVHRKFPQEMAAAARLLIDYGELEINLMNCVNVARRDLDTVLKTMFRTRGEKQRIDIADALGRGAYRKIGILADFEAAIAAIHHCRIIRNQYAHAYWHDHGGLCLVALEALANQDDHIGDLSTLKFHYINAALLQSQVDYFQYTADLLLYANYQGRFLSGEVKQSPYQRPPSAMQKPPLKIDPPT